MKRLVKRRSRIGGLCWSLRRKAYVVERASLWGVALRFLLGELNNLQTKFSVAILDSFGKKSGEFIGIKNKL